MSLSEDEDDFLSADEDEYTCQSGPITAAETKHKETRSGRTKIETENEENAHLNQEESCRIQAKVAKEVIEEKSKTEAQEVTKVVEATSRDRQPAGVAKVDEDDDDEEVVAERIRERNLRIARKFSAEIAKNVKASAPIPVKLAPPQADFSVNDNDFQNNVGRVPHSIPPPAPPSTPALSSSFNNNNESSPIVGTMTALGAAASTISQYGWRIPSVVRGTNEPKMESSVAAAATETSSSKSKPNQSDPARSALDRLSEKLSKPEKNLFEMVAEDIKKVTLKPGTSSASGGNDEQQGIPLISDIGSMLGGWGWNSASQLLASATQVTSQMTSQVGSQVGSVIDSVVQKANPQPGSNQLCDKEGFDKNK